MRHLPVIKSKAANNHNPANKGQRVAARIQQKGPTVSFSLALGPALTAL